MPACRVKWRVILKDGCGRVDDDDDDFDGVSDVDVVRREVSKSWEIGLDSMIKSRSQRVESRTSALMCSGLTIQRIGLLSVRGCALWESMYLSSEGRSDGSEREKRWMLARGIVRWLCGSPFD